MIKKSIISKLWVSIVILIIIVLFTLSFGVSNLLEKFYYSQITKDLVTQGEQLVKVLNSRDHTEKVKEQLDLLSIFNDAHIVIVEKDGLVDSCSSMMGLDRGSAFQPEELQKVFTGEIVAKKAFFHHFSAPMLSVAIPIYNDNQINSALMLFRPIAPITDTINSMRKLIVFAALGAIILASIISFFLSRTLSRPLIQMNKIAQEMAKGNFNNKIIVKSNDEVGLLSTSLNNMSEQLKRSITDLSYEKAKLENVLDSMSDGVITLNAKGNIILINPPAEKFLTNYEKDEILKENFFTIVNIPELKDLFTKVTLERKIQNRDIDLNDRIIAIRMAPLLSNDTKNVLGVVAILQDVTKERHLEQMRRDFTANVSHELRTPLSLMQGYSEALLDDVITEEQEKTRVINIIHQETLRLKRMVNDLLDLSRIQTGHFTLNKIPLEIEDLLKNIAEKYKTKIDKTNIAFELQIPPNLPKVLGDYDRLQQVLINLIENALNHTEKGKITLSAHKEDEQILIKVTDTGSGMSKDETEFVWERFYKIDKSRNRQKGGTGLGLAIVKNIIKAHKGEVWVESKLGKGSTFGVTLPISEKNPAKDL